MRTLLVSAALLSVCQMASAQGLPPVVQAAVRQAESDCPGGPMTKPGFLTRKDINGDRVADFILDAKMPCREAASFWCGSGGCQTKVFASMSDGSYVKVIEGVFRDLIFRQVRGRPAVVMSLHGSECGQTGALQCSKTLYWNGAQFNAAN